MILRLGVWEGKGWKWQKFFPKMEGFKVLCSNSSATLRCENCFFLEQGKDQENAAQHKKMKMKLLVVVLLVVSLGLNDLNRRDKL